MSEQPTPVTSWRDGLRRTPLAWKIAAAVGVVGWFLTLGWSTTTTVDGAADCDGTDLGPLVVAAVVTVLAIVGWRQTRRGHPATRLPRRLAVGGLAVLAALVVVHVLRAVVDPSGGMC
ncbi:MAG TPA: hypothetical protein VFT09_04860 [Ilumatobacteraceae bacterium]|nr:hypothetical protein [Ilumatobacteraceae bacterium]